MSVSFEIGSSLGPYPVTVESHGFHRFVQTKGEMQILADEFFADRLKTLESRVIYAAAHETTKSLEAMSSIIEEVRAAGAKRQTHLVAVGGGILQDVSAFIASIYMRGLSWTYVPTTVLAMVDSCIGGKSSINVGPYKNLVGTFHPPAAVLIDPELASTLSAKDYSAGLVEAAKICFCRGAEVFDQYLSCRPGAAMPVDALEKVITESLLAKKWFIEVDEFDKKERLLLNFGHTFGHAIEGASHYSISHGIAVGLGIECALEFGRQAGTKYHATPRVGLLEAHLRSLVLADPDIKKHVSAIDLDEVLRRFSSDKKHSRESYTLILVDGNGDVVLRQVPQDEQTRAQIRNAVETVVDRYIC